MLALIYINLVGGVFCKRLCSVKRCEEAGLYRLPAQSGAIPN